MPLTIAGTSAGRYTLKIIWLREALKLLPTRTSTGSMRRTAAATVSATGKNADSAPSAAFEAGPTPKSRIAIGKNTIFGAVAMPSRYGPTASRSHGRAPTTMPVRMPAIVATANPTAISPSDTARL